ncbi:MAG: tetratricopeptide repeat protein [Ignavibacteriaceae bacterium]|nr:tetratricopeptide repeat protein [Ignavibacteriaceae bacterium]
MSKSTTQIFDDKVNLIYEYDKRSPLFIRMANTEIEKNNIQKAIEILSSGLKGFPDYAAAYILLGRAYTLLGNYGKALFNIKTGCDLIHSSQTYEYYLGEIENIKKQRSLFEPGRRSSFMPSVAEDEENKDELLLFEPKVEVEDEIKLEDFDEQLDVLAQKISHAKMSAGEVGSTATKSELPEEKNTPSYENLIVSETLAKIYIAQGEYAEAVNVYEKLKKKNPDKLDYYDGKIKELQKQIDF